MDSEDLSRMAALLMCSEWEVPSRQSSQRALTPLFLQWDKLEIHAMEAQIGLSIWTFLWTTQRWSSEAEDTITVTDSYKC